MGIKQSLQKLQSFQSFHLLTKSYPPTIYFPKGYQIYHSKFNTKQQYLKHQIQFQSIKSANQFLEEVKTVCQNKKVSSNPFNILYPISILSDKENSLTAQFSTSCSQESVSLFVVHKYLGKSMIDYLEKINSQRYNLQKNVQKQHLKEQNYYYVDQRIIWFVINEITKSLEMLEEKGHSHHNLLPQTIFYNQNQNWYIYDGHYILGNWQNISQYYQQKSKRNQFMSTELKYKLESTNIILTNNDTIEEDVYCFGYCVVYLMSGVHPSRMPRQGKQREKYVKELLDKLAYTGKQLAKQSDYQSLQSMNDKPNGKYSQQLLTFIQNFIKPDPRKRYTIKYIRNYLKQKQQQIFLNQQQWTRSSGQQSRTNIIGLKSQQKFKQKYKQSQNNKQLSSPLSKYQSKSRKLNRIKSSQKIGENQMDVRNYNHTQYTEYSQGSNHNINSMRTLKKVVLPQKIVMMEARNVGKFPLELEENWLNNDRKQYNKQNYRIDRSGQVTPIRKIDDISTRNINKGKKEIQSESLKDYENSHSKYRAENQSNNNNGYKANEQTKNYLQFENSIRATMNSPNKQGSGYNYGNVRSMNQHRNVFTGTLSPPGRPLLLQNNVNIRQQHNSPPLIMKNMQQPPKLPIISPHNAFQSPFKVKMSYFSPQKINY